MLKPLEAAKAKERQLRKPADSVSQNSDEQTETRTDESIASRAGDSVSHNYDERAGRSFA
jgi:hypothetical protein